MNTITSLISIIVPSFNQSHYLEDSLSSVLNQTHTNWECIIVNDGSTDKTDEVTQDWLKKDSRFKYLQKENGGLSNARNSGIKMAKGQYILPLDADDKIGVDYIKLALAEFNANQELKVVYCQAEKFGAINEKWNLTKFSLKTLCSKNMIFCSAIYKKEDWIRINGYDVKMIHGLEDWEFWIALLKNGGDVKQLDYIGFYYRINSGSMLDKLNLETEEEMLNYMSIKHIDFYTSQSGSFTNLIREKESSLKTFERKLKSKKFVINLFTNKFFCFKIFKLK